MLPRVIQWIKHIKRMRNRRVAQHPCMCKKCACLNKVAVEGSVCYDCFEGDHFGSGKKSNRHANP